MQKYITKRNLLILNIVLGLILALTGFFGVVYPLLSAKSVDATPTVEKTETEIIRKTITRPVRATYDIITDNDLFVYKGPKTEKITTVRQVYDLTKVWELNGAFNSFDGPHAWIRDKGLPDTVSKQPFTTHEVVIGQTLESDKPPRVYNVEILDIAKDPETGTWFVKYYRYDMVDSVEEDRIFYLRAW